MTPLRIVISGVGGRMGQTLVATLRGQTTMQLHAALIAPHSAHHHAPTHWPSTIPISSDPDLALTNADVLIDFTRPEGTLSYLAPCVRHHTAMVIGTTGLSRAARARIEQAAEHIAIVFAPNFSIGVNLMFKLLEQASVLLSHNFDVALHEIHHRNKVDAPSGTALQMAAILDAHTPAAQPTRINSVRAGDCVGEHTVLFCGMGEHLTITHQASNRSAFATGALRAALWVHQQTAGLYSMQDVLATTGLPQNKTSFVSI